MGWHESCSGDRKGLPEHLFLHIVFLKRAYAPLLREAAFLLHILKEKGVFFFMQSIDTVSAEELDSYIGRQDAVIIDLREKEAYEKSHL